jgi:pseudaminic acid synthase
MKIKIKNNLFFDDQKPPLTIAEISSNHGGDKKKFIKHINLAKEAGCELVKIQTYEANDLTIKTSNEKFTLKNGLWKNTNLWDLYKKAETPFKWHNDAFKLAKRKRINLFSTPFSIRSLKFLKKFNPPIYKISSFEITDLKLIHEIAKLKKPTILSTGLANIQEIKNAVRVINKFHNNIIIMYCVSGYPTPIKEMNLKTILNYKKIFPKNMIGLSDHTNTIHSALASIPFNIVAIEKHFKINNKIISPDSKFSITTAEMKKLNNLKKDYFSSLGNQEKKIKHVEKHSLIFRRSLYASQKIQKGELFSEKNIKSFRPKIGICASNYFKILGKKSRRNIKKNQPLLKSFIV